MDSATGYLSAISQTPSIRPLGVAHLYDAFSTCHELDIRNDALRAFELPEAAISADLSVVVPWANQILPAAGPARKVPAEEDDNDSVVSVASSNAPAAKNPAAVVDLITDEDESDEESEEDFELSEKEQRFLQEAYDTYANIGDAWIQQRATSPPSCRTPFADAGNVQAVFDDFINLPDSWPLMRILIPLDGLSLIERIISCVAAELVATHLYADTQTKFVKRIAKKLTAILACYLAGEVVSMVSPVAAVEHKEMVAPMCQPLLTPVYWVRPIYTELLHSSSRLRKDTRIETARPSNGLVKIMCSPKAQGETPINATAYNKGHTHWLGSASHVQSLYVWVPAHWAPNMCEVIKARTDWVDSQRDEELQAARAWGQEPEQQPQRDGAGIGNATVVGEDPPIDFHRIHWLWMFTGGTDVTGRIIECQIHDALGAIRVWSLQPKNPSVAS